MQWSALFSWQQSAARQLHSKQHALHMLYTGCACCYAGGVDPDERPTAGSRRAAGLTGPALKKHPAVSKAGNAGETAAAAVAGSARGGSLPRSAEVQTGLKLGVVPPLRVLVCAQSNAAIDELACRLADEGVWSESGLKRKPGMVRLGRSEVTHSSVRMFHVDALADFHLQQQHSERQQLAAAGQAGDAAPAAAAAAAAEQDSRRQQLEEQLREVERQLAALAAAKQGVRGGPAGAATEAAAAGQDAAGSKHEGNKQQQQQPRSGAKRRREAATGAAAAAGATNAPTGTAAGGASKRQRTAQPAAAAALGQHCQAASGSSSGSDMQLSDEVACAAHNFAEREQQHLPASVNARRNGSTECRESRSRSRDRVARKVMKQDSPSRHKGARHGSRPHSNRNRDNSWSSSRSTSRSRGRRVERDGNEQRRRGSSSDLCRRSRGRSRSRDRHTSSSDRDGQLRQHSSSGKGEDGAQRQQQPQQLVQVIQPAQDAAVGESLLRDRQRALLGKLRAVEMERQHNRGPAAGAAARELERQRPEARHAVVRAAEIVVSLLQS